MFIIIVFLLGNDRLLGLIFFRARFTPFRARFTPFHTRVSLLTFFVSFFILFHSSCSLALVFLNVLVHQSPISYSHTEWYLLFTLCESNE